MNKVCADCTWAKVVPKTGGAFATCMAAVWNNVPIGWLGRRFHSYGAGNVVNPAATCESFDDMGEEE